MSRLQCDGNINQTGFFQDYCKTGLGLFEFDSTVQYLENHLNSTLMSLGSRISKSYLVKRFIKNSVLYDGTFSILALKDDFMPYVFYKLGKHLIADWFNVYHLLNNVLLKVSTFDEGRVIKGPLFEKSLLEYINQSNLDVKHLFHPNIIIKENNETIGEIDISLISGSIAFIVECKAYSSSTALIWGNKDANNNRWSYTEDWLRQVFRITEYLSCHPEGDNYCIPLYVKYLVPIVYSPAVEHVYFDDDKYLVTPDIPRICIPDELIELLDLNLHDIINNKYTFKIIDRGCINN
ncbi:MAG: NERD domain-containing protein [Armatimonadota bacterium]